MNTNPTVIIKKIGAKKVISFLRIASTIAAKDSKAMRPPIIATMIKLPLSYGATNTDL
jgi:hypothetical protein